MELEKQRMDSEHYMSVMDRTKMLTVQNLIDYLKTQNPNAYIVAYKTVSEAYVNQLSELPNGYVCTVAEDKKSQLEFLRHFYKDTENADQKIDELMKREYRYVNDDDIVIRF